MVTRTGQGTGKTTFAVDVGGSNIKAMLLDATGRPTTERIKRPTPRPATTRPVTETIVAIAKEIGPFDRASVGFPGVVRKGVVETAFNLHPSWIGVDVDRLLTKELRVPVRAANDADVQGLGAVRGQGVELVITLGTGFGSSLFVDGRLVPNVQLAHHTAWRRKTYEEELGKKALKKAGRKKWNRRVEKAIASLSELLNYDRLYIGGGNASRIDFDLPPPVKVVSNVEGLLGGVVLWRGKENCYGVR